eukprot:12927553-Prorocentrum_lima.AAC.1
MLAETGRDACARQLARTNATVKYASLMTHLTELTSLGQMPHTRVRDTNARLDAQAAASPPPGLWPPSAAPPLPRRW